MENSPGVVVVAAGVVVVAAGVVVVAAGVVVLAADQLHNNECYTTPLSFIKSCVQTLTTNCTTQQESGACNRSGS